MAQIKTCWQRYRILIVLSVGLVFFTVTAFHLFSIDASTFLAILLPASVGVLGSWGLYLKRRADDTRRLRKALQSELEGMTWFDIWPYEDGSVPPFDPVPSTVYDENADSLGLLTDAEVTSIVEFYSRADVTGKALGYHVNKNIEADSSLINQDLDVKERQDKIAILLDRLALSHQRTLLNIQQELEGTGQHISGLTAGEVVTKEHPVVENRKDLCTKYALLEKDGGGQLRVTEKGAAFFEGELSTANLQKDYDVLQQDEGLFDWLKRGLGLRGNEADQD